ncbi:MAG: hypothetical protein NUV61_01025 [Candidatus Azambacteria bacterium]|nr:hypothetical protein [Candidatus Azambacteria bacterium]
MKNIIIIAVVIVGAALIWGASMWFVPQEAPFVQPAEVVSTSTEEVVVIATSTEPIAGELPVVSPLAPAEPARIMLTKTQFPYTITIGKTPCGDVIGSLDVVSTDPAKELYWGMTGAMPIWLAFSAVEGKTPATIDMSFNCIMSGAEEDINWGFIVVEKTKEGKYVDGYYRSFKIEGDIIKK